MSRAPYTLARSCTRADETYHHRRHLAPRLLALARLAGGVAPVLSVAVLGRAASPSGPAVSVGVVVDDELRHLGYVLRPGLDAHELRNLLREDLGLRPMREAA